MVKKKFSNIVFLAAPILLCIYGTAHFIDGLDGKYGPGLAWTLGHFMFLLALVTFGSIIVVLRANISASGKIANFMASVAMVFGLLGLVLFIRVAIIDIITGLTAGNNASMGIISAQLNNYPLTALAKFYNLGPLFFQLGLLVLMLQAIFLKPRQAPWWSPAMLLAGFLVLGFNTNLLVPGSILILIAFLPFYSTKNFVTSKLL